MAPVQPSIHDAIKTARTAARLSQAELAIRLGTTQQQIAKWEKTQVPSLDTIPEIEDALGVDRGGLLVAAGYVDITSVENAVVADSSLPTELQDAILVFVRHVRGGLSSLPQ